MVLNRPLRTSENGGGSSFDPNLLNKTRLVLRSGSTADQLLSAAVGDTNNIKFGTPTVEDTAFVTLTSAEELITFIQDGIYFISLDFQLDRTSPAGTSTSAFRAAYTPSGGSVDYTSPIVNEISNATSKDDQYFSSLAGYSAGDTLQFQFGKETEPTTVQLASTALSTLGWGTGFSASITIHKLFTA